MTRPLIALSPLWDEKRDSLWMLPGYMEGILHFGGVPVMLPLCDDREVLERALRGAGGLLLTGGHDVSPERYGQAPMDAGVVTCPQRDSMESVLLDLALAEDLPVFGICRGLQFLNVHLGGTLFQDLPSQHPSAVSHRQMPPYDLPSHSVSLSGPLARLLGAQRLEVNSCHHQAVRELAAGLEGMAVSEDGLTEAVCMPSRTFVWAVQWHPEFFGIADAASAKLFEAFVEACCRREKA